MRAVMHCVVTMSHVLTFKMPESGFATLENGQLPPLDRQIGTAGSSGFLLGLRSTIRWESEQSESNKCASANTDSPESKRHPSYIGGPPLYMIRRRNVQIPDVMRSRYICFLAVQRINFLKKEVF